MKKFLFLGWVFSSLVSFVYADEKSDQAIQKFDSSQKVYFLDQRAFQDARIKFDFAATADNESIVLLHTTYAIELHNLPVNKNKWQSLELHYRGPRFDQSGAKIEPALLVDLRLNGEVIKQNILFDTYSPNALQRWERDWGRQALRVLKGEIQFKDIDIELLDYSYLTPPKNSGEESNFASLIDSVNKGKHAFKNFGCVECHAIEKDSTAMKSGPNLFGLFQLRPRDRDIVEAHEGHKLTLKADNNYLIDSVRKPALQLATNKKGEAFPAIMPAYDKEAIADEDIAAIGDFLKTLNEGHIRGPAVKLVPVEGQAVYIPEEDAAQYFSIDRTRIQRGPMQGGSGRSIHVGFPWGLNYSFDPRVLSIVKIWQGGFLDMSAELKNRGGGGLKPGYASQTINFGSNDTLFRPLNDKGEPIDFSFKESRFEDVENMVSMLNSKEDLEQQLKEINAKFLGYKLDSRNPQAAPVFNYRIADNLISVKTEIDDHGKTTVTLGGSFKSSQVFKLNFDVLKQIQISEGKIEGDTWVIKAGENIVAELKANIGVSSTAWKPKNLIRQPVEQKLRKNEVAASLPEGYVIESYYPPLDEFGRPQLFEALGAAQAKDGTIVVSTRSAGIWHLREGKWSKFAEGFFDSLGVVVEDDNGYELTVGQKAELTRVSDTNRDGIADRYTTLFDSFAYHGNYHSYMHGPVKSPDGSYLITLNLAHDDASHKGGGAYMGTFGGYRGWGFLIQKDGSYEAWVNGLRSPASLGVDLEGNFWYADNQGEYVGTSKLFKIKKGGFYGHPSGLVDLPGMTPDSKEISWKKYKTQREPVVALFPHNRLANSPGNLVWSGNEKFGPFKGQAFIGDQTLSNLMRIDFRKVNGKTKATVMPFVDGLESGAMRPVFLQDGSLLVGQTGRGWRAKGGQIASLQHIKWDGKTPPMEVQTVNFQSGELVISFTHEIEKVAPEDIEVNSWVYRDAPDYGSEELGSKQEKIESLVLSEDKKSIRLKIAKQKYKRVHAEQTDRVVHIRLSRAAFFPKSNNLERTLEAYITLDGNKFQ